MALHAFALLEKLGEEQSRQNKGQTQPEGIHGQECRALQDLPAAPGQKKNRGQNRSDAGCPSGAEGHTEEKRPDGTRRGRPHMKFLFEVEELPKVEDKVQAQKDYQAAGDDVHDLCSPGQETSRAAEQHAQQDEHRGETEHEQDSPDEHLRSLPLHPAQLVDGDSPYQRQIRWDQRQDTGGQEREHSGGKGDKKIDVVRHHGSRSPTRDMISGVYQSRVPTIRPKM